MCPLAPLRVRFASQNRPVCSAVCKQSDLSSENGDLIVNLDDSIKNYTIYPSTSSGDITIGDTSYSTTNGAENQITIGSGQKVLKVRTQSGDIEIAN